jgi:hypothetical protein
MFAFSCARSYKGTAVILFTKTKASQMCSVVTMDVNDAESKVRSCHSTTDVTGESIPRVGEKTEK